MARDVHGTGGMWFLLMNACSPAPVATRPPPGMPEERRRARLLQVDCNGGADFVTIDDAIHDANSGDRIEVAPCTYEGSLAFKGRSVWIVAPGGPDVTTIVATPGEPVVSLDDGEDVRTGLEGFTLTGGGGADQPAIDVQFSSLTLKGDHITGNAGIVTVYGNAAHLVVDGSILDDNAPTEGMVIKERRGMTLLNDTTVRCGAVPTGYITEHGAAFVDRSTFDCDGQTALNVYHSDGRVQRSVLDGQLVVDNESLEQERTVVEDVVLLDGAALSISEVTLRNVVSTGPITAAGVLLVVEGSVVTGAACGLRATDGSDVTVRGSDFWGNTVDACGDLAAITGDGNLAVDPRFVDAEGGDFHLAGSSPLRDAGPVGDGYADPDGSRNDVGAFGGPLSLGGGW
jgi:hypothetical protein